MIFQSTRSPTNFTWKHIGNLKVYKSRFGKLIGKYNIIIVIVTKTRITQLGI